MTRRTPVLALLTAATAFALVACSHPAGSGSASTHRSRPASAGLGANGDDTGATPPDDTTGQNGDSGTGTGTGTGNGTGHGSPNPSRSTATGPQIVSFTATGAVCPAHGPGYDQPGEVTISWKISGGSAVSLAMDGGQYSSYTGQQGSDKLPFQCPNAVRTHTHKYTLTIKNTNVTKTVSASAPAEPA